MFYTTLWNLTITVAVDYNGLLHVGLRPQKLSCKVAYEVTLIAQVWILWL